MSAFERTLKKASRIVSYRHFSGKWNFYDFFILIAVGALSDVNIGWQWRNFVANFRRHLVGKTLEMFVRPTPLSLKYVLSVGVSWTFSSPNWFWLTCLNNMLNLHTLRQVKLIYPQNGERIVTIDLWHHFTVCLQTNIKAVNYEHSGKISMP